MQREHPRPRIGISACLLGEPVRYNGGDKRHAWLVEVLGPTVEWVAVCPEVEIGLGTPRDMIDLVQVSPRDVRLQMRRTRTDLTSRMEEYATRRVEELAALRLSGYVLKSGSPSCGARDVPIVDSPDAGRGLFAAVLMRRFPDLPIVEERDLEAPARRDAFVARVRAHHSKIRP